jgi:3-oxoacyl-[acyl-carrier-protein] synthase-1
MHRVYFGTDNIITSLGFTTGENAENITNGISGIKVTEDKGLFPTPLAYSAVNTEKLETLFSETFKNSCITEYKIAITSRLEKMFLTSICTALENTSIDPSDPGTVMIFSTTKGNIDEIETRYSTLETRNSRLETRRPRVLLWEMAQYIAKLLNCYNVPVVVSNACTSGSVAIMQAARLIASGKFDHAIVTGGDIISEFVVSGFQSFQALSPEACRPFDRDRTGLSLGEGCGTVILTADPSKAGEGRPVMYLGGATSNDANHISGPSRDGEGLYLAIAAAMKEAEVAPGDLDFISAHGTATPYNDEMESLALAWAALENVPVNSFKGYIGHTLGAAGLIETILSVYSMKNDFLFKSIGYQNIGVSRPLNIIEQNIHQPVNTVLKTASGFGGCNAALVLSSHNPAQ